MKCSKTFLRCINPMVWASLCIFLPLIGLTKTFSTKVDSQNAHKMRNFKYPLSIEIGMFFYNERHPLLMKCFKTFLRCTRQMGGASLCIYLPLIGLTKLCSTKVDSQNAHKIPDVGYPLSTKMGCHSNRRGIHCLWSISNPSSDVWDWWEELLMASVYPLLVPLGHFLPGLALKLLAKCHIWDTLSVQKMGCWPARRDIQCLWSASKPFLDALSGGEELPCTSLRHLCISLSLCSTKIVSQIILPKCKCWVSSQS